MISVRKMNLSKNWLHGIFGVLVLFVGCSQSAPEIQSVNLRLIYREVSPRHYVERMGFFILPRDEDGFADLDTIYLINDNNQLFWTLNSEDWLSFQKNGDTWIGSHSIAMPEDAPLARGLYRIILKDKGGSQIEKTIGFVPPLVPQYGYPGINIKGSTYQVSSSYPQNLWVVYDGKGSFIKTIPVTSRTGTFNQLKLPSTAKTLAIWAEDVNSNVAALTLPFLIP